MTLRLNLALQGGGAHGAFTWGVLDRLLEEEIEIEGITATSAGAMNAAALKAGWVADGAEGARVHLAAFWNAISDFGLTVPDQIARWFSAVTPAPEIVALMIETNPAFRTGELLTRYFSPYDLNPLNIHPLRPLVEGFFNFDHVCHLSGPKLFINATNVRTGKVRVFSGDEIDADAILASACLPTLYQAIEKFDPETRQVEAFWDGGYTGNPALFPLFYETEIEDILIVHINPIERPGVPKTAQDILNRINEVSFNSSLLRELRAIHFVKRLIAEGRLAPGSMKDMRIHSIMDDATMLKLNASTKLVPNRILSGELFAAGRAAMERFWESEHREKIGSEGSVNLKAMFG